VTYELLRVYRYKRYDENDTVGGKASKTYVGVYCALTFAFWCIQTLRTGGFFLWSKRAADRSMRRSLHRILNSPMAFYLSKPVGELLATFSSDQDKIDESLPDALHLACAYRTTSLFIAPLLLLRTHTVALPSIEPHGSTFLGGNHKELSMILWSLPHNKKNPNGGSIISCLHCEVVW
jgi:hypothetical protein